MKEQYCEWCGSVLLENGRCPIEDCVQNVLIDELAKAEQEATDKTEEKKDENPTA
ncbi:hypothetical protein [Veillonella sp. VA137]|uniref:hypothetical protein n=1 Tax=Veillonella sp. VA137 TaxID=741828 RepID=UPI0013DEC604|nr:hypothetical protein [Veillonella sp. VA137]